MKSAATIRPETVVPSSNSRGRQAELCVCVCRNIIHGSDTLENAKMEIDLWFKAEELVNYTPCSQAFIYE